MRPASAKERILVVDDQPATLDVIRRNLLSRGFRITTAGGVDAALELLEDTPFDLVITDVRMPGRSGLELVKHVRQNLADTEVMVITGFATVEEAVEAMKNGAGEYLEKPFTYEELSAAVGRAIDKLHLRRAASSRAVATPAAPAGVIGESPVLNDVFRSVAKAARAPVTVMISGESGTGKELIARAIHYSGPRASAPFVAVNCGGIPESLLESELFGHEKGAFTGAQSARAGFFEAADGGTIFLDEVSETSLAMQVKLLRVLQEREVTRVGSSAPRSVDVRIVAASNKDLITLVKRGTFRDDLYYRLNVIPIELPPLRDRGDDILLLIQHFAKIYAAAAERPLPEFTDPALQALRAYRWPGNVRELQNVINRLVVMTDGHVIDVPDLPALMRIDAPRPSGPLRTLAEVEAAHIRRVLASVDGNKTRAAKILGIDRKTLREKLKRLENQG